MSKKLENFIKQATENITEDRAAAKTLLMTLMKHIHQSEERHQAVGLVAAKYLETLQRSNEQLVKIASLVQKQTASDQGISEEDRQELFDLINGDEEDVQSNKQGN
jgi:F0F1-type ATP synthase membrane subunit b/b'